MSDSWNERIVKIEKVTLKIPQPRDVGFNSRKGAHGVTVVDPVLRLHTEGGAVGVGWSRLDRPGAEALLGNRLSDLFRLPDGTLDGARSADLPLWDLAAKIERKPLYQLLGARGSRAVELYDGSVYIDDLKAGDEEAVEIFREEVRCGREYGYRNFKIKIGRGHSGCPSWKVWSVTSW